MNTTQFTTHTRDNPNMDITLDGIEVWLAKAKSKWKDWEIDSITSIANIEWEFYIEMRTWGVKSFGVYATECALEISIDYFSTPDDTETIEFDLTKDIKDFELNTENFPKSSYESKDSFQIQSVDIDFTAKTITVYF